MKVYRITRPFRTRWDLIMMVLALYNCFTVPFFVSFYTEKSVMFFVLNTLIDMVFLCDVYLNFYTTYIDKNGDEITDHKKIVHNYVTGGLWLDLVASVPIDNFIVFFVEMSAGS